MGILTLFKANIRYKKSSFIGVIILMVIIAMSITSVFCIRDNYTKGIENELDRIHASDLTVYFPNNKFSDETLNKVRKNELVSSVVDIPSVFCERIISESNIYPVNWFLLELRDEYRVLNNDLTGYVEDTDELKSGEMYTTLGLKTGMGIDIGDTLTVETYGGKYQFTIKGFVAEPVTGCAAIDQKQVFISDEDFENIFESNLKKETESISSIFHLIQINKAEDCNISDQLFRRQLNLDTGILNSSMNSITKSMSIEYTTLIPDILLAVIIVLNIIFIIALLIFISHNITTEIEMNYVDLGIIKALGFTQRDIRLLYIFQYIAEQLFGIIIGVIISIPVTKAFGRLLMLITAVPPQNNISFMSVLQSLTCLIIVIVVSANRNILITEKIGIISPVRAISRGKDEIYFDSRFKIRIRKNPMSLWLSLRNFVTDKRRYIGIVFLVSFLVFFISSITVLGYSFNSKSTLESMGGVYAECSVVFYDEADNETIEHIEETIEQYSPIDNKYYYNSKMFYLNGEEIHCTIYEDFIELYDISLGRAPIYKNEIAITGILADEYNLNIGDKVTVARDDKSADYIISGLFNSQINMGQDFMMPLIGAKRIGVNNINYGDYSLNDPSQSKKIVNALNDKFGDIIKAENAIEYTFDNGVETIIFALRALIYTLSVIFFFIAINMVCTKIFMQEKIDIGIYKAIGLTSKKLRLQFAIRFLIIALIGSLFGVLFTVLFTKPFLLYLLKFAGITSIDINFSVLSILVSVLMVCISFFVFSYFVSYRIKKIKPKELIIE